MQTTVVSIGLAAAILGCTRPHPQSSVRVSFARSDGAEVVVDSADDARSEIAAAFTAADAAHSSAATMLAEADARRTLPAAVRQQLAEQAPAVLHNPDGERFLQLLLTASDGGVGSFQSESGRSRLFVETRDDVCLLAGMNQLFSGFARAMSIFDSGQAEEIGEWLGLIEGGIFILGSGLGIAAAAMDPGTDRDVLTGIAGGTAGAGGLFELFQGTGMDGIDTVRATFSRVEINRQFGIRLRAIDGLLGRGSAQCRDSDARAAEVRAAATAGGEVPQAARVSANDISGLRAILDSLSGAFRALVEVAAAADEVAEDLGLDGELSAPLEDVRRALEALAAAGAEVDRRWGLREPEIAASMACLEECVVVAP